MAEQSEEVKLAKSVQQACVEAAREGFRDASMSGLCTEGAIEAAIGAIQKLDIEEIIQRGNKKQLKPDHSTDAASSC